jgi:hypothetical protein
MVLKKNKILTAVKLLTILSFFFPAMGCSKAENKFKSPALLFFSNRILSRAGLPGQMLTPLKSSYESRQVKRTKAEALFKFRSTRAGRNRIV